MFRSTKRNHPSISTSGPEERPSKCPSPCNGFGTSTNKRVEAPSPPAFLNPNTRALLLGDPSRELQLLGNKEPNKFGLHIINVSCLKQGQLTASWSVNRSKSQLCSLHDRLKQILPKDDASMVSPTDNINIFLSVIMFGWKSQVWKDEPEIKDYVAAFLTKDADFHPELDDNQNRHPNASPKSSILYRHNKRSSLETTKATLDDFSLVKLVGKGSFGEVFLSKRKSDESTFAIKILSKADMVRRKQCDRVNIEKHCLSVIRCPFVVKLETCFASDTHLFFVQTMCQAGELYFHLDRSQKLTSKLARFYTAECAIALQAIHDQGIVYRDLKPENIMIDFYGHLKLVDFGLAKIGVESSVTGATSFVGTSEYLSPEMVKRERHGFAVDWWGLGMVLFEMLTGLPPWYCDDRKRVMKSITDDVIEFPKGEVSVGARSLIRSLLHKDSRYRLGSLKGIEEIKAHSYFNCLDFNKVEEKRIKPPYIPSLISKTDVSYFDTSFTSQSVVHDSSVSYEDSRLVEEAEKRGAFKGF